MSEISEIISSSSFTLPISWGWQDDPVLVMQERMDAFFERIDTIPKEILCKRLIERSRDSAQGLMRAFKLSLEGNVVESHRVFADSMQKMKNRLAMQILF